MMKSGSINQVCRAAQETWGTRQTNVYSTGVKKTPFLRICSLTLPGQKHTKIFSVNSLRVGHLQFQI